MFPNPFKKSFSDKRKIIKDKKKEKISNLLSSFEETRKDPNTNIDINANRQEKISSLPEDPRPKRKGRT